MLFEANGCGGLEKMVRVFENRSSWQNVQSREMGGISPNPNYRSLRLWRDILSLKDSSDNIRFFVRSGYKNLFWLETHSLYSFNVDDIFIVCLKC